MNDVQAAVDLVQLKKLDGMVEMRRNIAHKLTALLDRPGFKLPTEKPGVKHTYYKYHLELPEYINKQEFIKEMGEKDVSVGILYDPPLHQSWLARNMLHTDVKLVISESVAPKTVSLPIFPRLTDSDISKISHAVNTVIENYTISAR